MDKLDCIRVFTEVARLGSFTAVANELNITQGAVSKKVAWLEKSIGFSLFHRTSRKMALTMSGAKYLRYCQTLIEGMDHTEQMLKSELSEAMGELRISVPSAFATQRLAEPLSRFMELNPKVTFNISVDDKHIDLYQDNIDIAIRASVLNDSSLKARKLMDHELCYFASPSYIEQNGEPTMSKELDQHKCITYSLSNPSNLWYLGGEKCRVNEIATSDSPELIVELAVAGKGIAAMPRWMVERYFIQGKLREVFKDVAKTSLPMYALYKGVDILPYRIRAFIDFLSEHFEAQD